MANFVVVRKCTIVISTKRSAWRNPLRRSSGYNYSYHKLGDLSTTLEMTVLFLVVISTKRSAWRNPLRRSRATTFLPQTRGSLDYARDDGTFYSVIQRVENPKNLLERSFFLVVISTK